MTISDLINYIELKLNLFIPNIEGYLQTITEIYRVSVQSLTTKELFLAKTPGVTLQRLAKP